MASGKKFAYHAPPGSSLILNGKTYVVGEDGRSEPFSLSAEEAEARQAEIPEIRPYKEDAQAEPASNTADATARQQSAGVADSSAESSAGSQNK